jgi:hypothetical protein
MNIIGINDASPIFQWMWKSCVLRGHKFFFWILLNDRLNTRNLLKRKNMDLQDYNCILCTRKVEEDLMHLFFECPFSKWCWRLVIVHWNTSLPPQDMLIRSRRQFNSIAVIFDGASISLRRWKEAFKDEFSLILHRAKSSKKALLQDWLSSL